MIDSWSNWLKDYQDSSLKQVYSYIKSIDEKYYNITLEKELGVVNHEFQKLIWDMKFVPIMPSPQILKTMMDEAIGADDQLEGLFYKIIPEYNFTEACMKIPEILRGKASLRKKLEKDLSFSQWHLYIIIIHLCGQLFFMNTVMHYSSREATNS